MADIHFITGFPGALATRLLQRLVRGDRSAKVWVLSQPRFAKAAKREIQSLPPAQAKRVHLLVGDVVDMHLGLSGSEYRTLTAEVNVIHHLAAKKELVADRRQLEEVNIGGTANVLELCRDSSRLSRLGHVSTVQVAGDRHGVIDEDELEEGQRFRNGYEETKYHGEVLVHRAKSELPISIFRPSTLIDDRPTHPTIEGSPYDLASHLVDSARWSAAPFPKDGSYPLNVVPADYVVDAMLQLSRRAGAVGKTFHLVDPNPMSVRKIYEQLQERPRPRSRAWGEGGQTGPRPRLPLLDRLLKRGRRFEHLEQLAIYRCRNTLEQLEGSGVSCPPLRLYLDRLVALVQEQASLRGEALGSHELPVEDPLY